MCAHTVYKMHLIHGRPAHNTDAMQLEHVVFAKIGSHEPYMLDFDTAYCFDCAKQEFYRVEYIVVGDSDQSSAAQHCASCAVQHALAHVVDAVAPELKRRMFPNRCVTNRRQTAQHERACRQHYTPLEAEGSLLRLRA